MKGQFVIFKPQNQKIRRGFEFGVKIWRFLPGYKQNSLRTLLYARIYHHATDRRCSTDLHPWLLVLFFFFYKKVVAVVPAYKDG